MASGSTFNVFYLGNTAPIDVIEGGNTADNANVIVGDTFGSTSDPLAANVQTFAPGSVSFTGGADSQFYEMNNNCLLYTSPSPRDLSTSRMPSSA